MLAETTTHIMFNKKEEISIENISRVDIQTFEKMFRMYYSMLCAHAHKFVNDKDTAEEIVQDLFYTIWEKKEELIIESSVKAYLYMAVQNRCLKHIGHKAVKEKHKEHHMLNPVYEEGDNPQTQAQLHEIKQIIVSTLDSLPKRCSYIFRLNRNEGLKYREIALKLSISVKTVESDMGKVLKALRDNLKDYY